MKFTVIAYPHGRRVTGRGEAFLERDSWNDYGYLTLFKLIVFDVLGNRFDVGGVKIVRAGQDTMTELPPSFEELSVGYASLGQEQAYYETLRSLPYLVRNAIFIGLRDVVYLPSLLESLTAEDVYRKSLVRALPPYFLQQFTKILERQFDRLPYSFRYHFPGMQARVIDFKVNPGSRPPSNIHVLIGRNGVGKTRLLGDLGKIVRGISDNNSGTLDFDHLITDPLVPNFSNTVPFANLIKVAFSAFDDYASAIFGGSPSGMRYSYVGLNRTLASLDSDGLEPQLRRKTLQDLSEEFTDSCLLCYRSSRRDLWVQAMHRLSTDPVFAHFDLAKTFDLHGDSIEEVLRSVYSVASSGHKIVLLTVSKLVELVGERTLVLIDEPEAHLHPPLQAALIRVLSWLLAERNGVAIVASHSPVMLQEVPSECVWIMQRTGEEYSYIRPSIETFAENVGILTREVFKLEVTNTGYHDLLRKAVQESESFEDVLSYFGNRVGAEGRAVARALWREK